VSKARTKAAKFSDHGSGVAGGVAHKKQRVDMPEQEKEEHEEADVDAWAFLQKQR
jgi:hypothetical protein